MREVCHASIRHCAGRFKCLSFCCDDKLCDCGLTPYKWVALFLAVGGFIRGFVSPHKCVSYKLFERLTARLNWVKKVNAGSKMFADKIAAIAGTAMVVTWLLGSSVGDIPAIAIMIFAFLDLSTGFCAACWVYSAWYKMRGT